MIFKMTCGYIQQGSVRFGTTISDEIEGEEKLGKQIMVLDIW